MGVLTHYHWGPHSLSNPKMTLLLSARRIWDPSTTSFEDEVDPRQSCQVLAGILSYADPPNHQKAIGINKLSLVPLVPLTLGCAREVHHLLPQSRVSWRRRVALTTEAVSEAIPHPSLKGSDSMKASMALKARHMVHPHCNLNAAQHGSGTRMPVRSRPCLEPLRNPQSRSQTSCQSANSTMERP